MMTPCDRPALCEENEQKAIEEAANVIKQWAWDGHWSAIPEASKILEIFRAHNVRQLYRLHSEYDMPTAKIELTPAMLEAGRKALIHWYDSDLLWDEGVEAVFRAISRVREESDGNAA